MQTKERPRSNRRRSATKRSHRWRASSTRRRGATAGRGGRRNACASGRRTAWTAPPTTKAPPDLRVATAPSCALCLATPRQRARCHGAGLPRGRAGCPGRRGIGSGAATRTTRVAMATWRRRTMRGRLLSMHIAVIVAHWLHRSLALRRMMGVLLLSMRISTQALVPSFQSPLLSPMTKTRRSSTRTAIAGPNGCLSSSALTPWRAHVRLNVGGRAAVAATRIAWMRTLTTPATAQVRALSATRPSVASTAAVRDPTWAAPVVVTALTQAEARIWTFSGPYAKKLHLTVPSVRLPPAASSPTTR